MHARTQPSKTLAYSWYRARRTFFLPDIADGGPLSTATNPSYKSHLQLKVHPELLHPFIADVVDDAAQYDPFPDEIIENVEDEKLFGKKRRAIEPGSKKNKLVHPAPERFDLIRADVEARLNESLKRFIDLSFSNTG